MNIFSSNKEVKALTLVLEETKKRLSELIKLSNQYKEEKESADKELKDTNLFNNTLLETNTDCLKILDEEGRILFMNFNGLCLMEIDDFSSIKNKNWWTLWGAENEELVKASIDKALLGETIQFTALSPTAKGTSKWWDVLVTPICRPGEDVKQIISISRDITAEVNSNKQ